MVSRLIRAAMEIGLIAVSTSGFMAKTKIEKPV